MSQKRPNREYSRKLKAIRAYVDFNYDLRKPLHSSQKAKINRYFDAISQIQSRVGNRVYRSKDRERVRTVQRFGQNEFETLPDIKVAFLEESDANPIERIRFDSGRLSVARKYFKTDYLEFDQKKLAVDPEKEIARVLAMAEPAFSYRIAAGKHSIAQPRTRRTLPGEIKRLMNRYGMDPQLRKHENEKSAKNHYWANWLTGVIPLYVENQTQLSEFLLKEKGIRKVQARKRKAARERARAKSKKSRSRR